MVQNYSQCLFKSVSNFVAKVRGSTMKNFPSNYSLKLVKFISYFLYPFSVCHSLIRNFLISPSAEQTNRFTWSKGTWAKCEDVILWIVTEEFMFKLAPNCETFWQFCLGKSQKTARGNRHSLTNLLLPRNWQVFHPLFENRKIPTHLDNKSQNIPLLLC